MEPWFKVSSECLGPAGDLTHDPWLNNLACYPLDQYLPVTLLFDKIHHNGLLSLCHLLCHQFVSSHFQKAIFLWKIEAIYMAIVGYMYHTVQVA